MHTRSSKIIKAKTHSENHAVVSINGVNKFCADFNNVFPLKKLY